MRALSQIIALLMLVVGVGWGVVFFPFFTMHFHFVSRSRSKRIIIILLYIAIGDTLYDPGPSLKRKIKTKNVDRCPPGVARRPEQKTFPTKSENAVFKTLWVAGVGDALTEKNDPVENDLAKVGNEKFVL